MLTFSIRNLCITLVGAMVLAACTKPGPNGNAEPIEGRISIEPPPPPKTQIKAPASFVGKTFYALDPTHTCEKDGQRIPSYRDAMYVESETAVVSLGDRCSVGRKEYESAPQFNEYGKVSEHASLLYDLREVNLDDGIVVQSEPYTEAICAWNTPEGHSNPIFFEKFQIRFTNHPTWPTAKYAQEFKGGDAPKPWWRVFITPPAPVLARNFEAPVLSYFMGRALGVHAEMTMDVSQEVDTAAQYSNTAYTLPSQCWTHHLLRAIR